MFAARLTGLQILKFGNDLSDKYSRRCGGAFRGICDEDILAVAVSNLSEPGQFVYLLTLNTHLPMYKAAGDESTGGCNELQINNAVGECLLMLRLKKILDNISEHVKATKMRTDWIIVGDHAPPFSNRSEREHFDNARVPYFIIFSE